MTAHRAVNALCVQACCDCVPLPHQDRRGSSRLSHVFCTALSWFLTATAVPHRPWSCRLHALQPRLLERQPAVLGSLYAELSCSKPLLCDAVQPSEQPPAVDKNPLNWREVMHAHGSATALELRALLPLACSGPYAPTSLFGQPSLPLPLIRSTITPPSISCH